MLDLHVAGNVGNSVCRGRGGDCAELLEEAEGVHEDAAVGHFAGFEAVDDHSVDQDAFAGGGDAEEWGAVGAGPVKTGDDFFAFGDHFVDGPVDVREGGTHHGEDAFQAFSALLLAWKRVELDEVFFNEIVGAVEAVLVDDFFDEGAHDLLVGF